MLNEKPNCGKQRELLNPIVNTFSQVKYTN